MTIKIKDLKELNRLFSGETAQSSFIAESAAAWLDKFHLLDDPDACIRVKALKCLRAKLKGNLDPLLPYAQSETDIFSKSLYFPFGPLVLLSLENPTPYKTMMDALKVWRWSDRGSAWDMPDQSDSLNSQWQAIDIGKWPKEKLSSWLIFLPLGAANFDSKNGLVFNAMLQFYYLTKHFFRPKKGDVSFFRQSEVRTQQFVRKRVADYMAGYFSKGRLLYERKQIGSSHHWYNCYRALTHDVKLAAIPETLGHLVYLCLKVQDQDEYSRLFTILRQEYSWFPQSSLEILQKVRNGGTQHIYQQQSPPFNLVQSNKEHRQYLGIAYNLAIKAMIEFLQLEPAQACKWLIALTPIEEAQPFLWLARVEALAACGSLALEELEKMLNSSAQPPHVRKFMMQYLALMQNEAGLPLLCKILTEQKGEERGQELVEGCLFCLSRLKIITNGSCVVDAIISWWMNNFNKSVDVEGRQFCLALALQTLSHVQFEDSSAMNENRIAAMIEAGLSSSDQQAPLAALHVRLVLTDEAVSLDANTIDNFKTIILAAANNGDNTEQLLKVLNELSNQEHLARALFDQSFSLEMLSNVQSNSQPLVLKLIRKIYPDLKTLFNRSFNGAANLLAHLLSPKMDVGTRLSALKILEEYPELWELKGVYDNVLKQASFNSNKEPATAAKALEVLSAHRLQDTNVQKAVLDFCSRFKEAPAPSMTAIRLVENNFFDFELTSDLGASLQKAINDCYASSSGRSYAQTEKTTYSSQDANIVFALCRLYGLLLRARIIYPLWPNFSILLNEAIINLDLVRMPFFWVRNGRRAIKAMISSYRLALDANLDDQSQIYDNFIGALNAVSSAESKCINRPQLLAAFLGLNLFREPPFELHKAFQQYNRQISALLTGEIKSTADTNALQEFIQKARTKVKEIYNDLPKPGDSGNGDPFTSHPFPESGLSPLLQEYLRQPSHDTYQKILKIINTLFPSGDEKNWCDSFRQHSVAYLAERQVSQYELWLNIARDRFHNADNQARRSLDNATPLQLQAHARRFMGLPALVNSLMIVKPEPIVIRDFLRECKNKFEGTFQCPGAINIATPDAGLSVYFDQRRLESVLENCFSNALHSVEGFNKDVKTAEDGKEPRKPKVSISASRQGAATEIKVMDNGGGLPPLFLKDEESKGLGTAIILEYVVNSAGGSVQWADNNPDNNLEGANVILSFPDKEIFDE